MRSSSRPAFAAIFVACAVLIGIALYMQEQMGLEPCPMCILQRYAFFVIGVIALVGAIHGPRGNAVTVYSGLVLLFAMLGGGISIRHSYLQHFPPATSACGTDLEFLVNTFPLSQALPKIFAGTGDCSVVHWKMLGLSIPEWALVWYLIFAATALYLIMRKPR